MRPAHTLIPAALVAISIGLYLVGQSNEAKTLRPASPSVAAADGRITYTTPNTMRLTGSNVYAAATAVTQATYGATHHEDRPHAITLARADRQADAMLAASRITTFPSIRQYSTWTLIGCRRKRSPK